eukprot:CAMPEP_0170511684 /NCGR_PEP_ID=MMETSP0208-20121228/66439_1 /TAXON_ID=197538 /ORGANISM="Strombidium inclinatum, Strain S3" /LENGTH=134 /DNA_ID=CAMNT_0010795245 /DNA_START=421 /DNA_END=825 /DNA_ORIENTATION=+
MTVDEPGHFEGVDEHTEEAVHPGLLCPWVFLEFPLQEDDETAESVEDVNPELDLNPPLGVYAQLRVIIQVRPIGVLCDDYDGPQQEHDGQLKQEPDELAAHLAPLLLRGNAVLLVVVERGQSLAALKPLTSPDD